jgi:hypothetical protein
VDAEWVGCSVPAAARRETRETCEVRWLGCIAILLSGCSGQLSLGPIAQQPTPPIVVAPGVRETVESNGQVLVEPDPPIEIVERALGQAQTVRSLVRSLSR